MEYSDISDIYLPSFIEVPSAVISKGSKQACSLLQKIMPLFEIKEQDVLVNHMLSSQVMFQKDHTMQRGYSLTYFTQGYSIILTCDLNGDALNYLSTLHHQVSKISNAVFEQLGRSIVSKYSLSAARDIRLCEIRFDNGIPIFHFVNRSIDCDIVYTHEGCALFKRPSNSFTRSPSSVKRPIETQ